LWGLSFQFSMETPKLSINTTNISGDLYQIDVLIENIPEKFLGTAFDLVISDPNWEYQGYKLGSIFSQPLSTLALVTQRQTPQKKIVFGVTLKHGFTIDSKKGTLASFNLRLPKKDGLSIELANGVLSTFENERKDLESVLWEKSTIGSTTTDKVSPTKKSVTAKKKPSKQEETTTETSEMEDETLSLSDPPPSNISPFHNFSPSLLFWIVLFLIVSGSGILLLWKFVLKKKIEPKNDS
jgi:hypothetical protein